jgi:hypothetical protein
MIIQIIATMTTTPALFERMLLTYLIIVHHLVDHILLGLLIHRLVVRYFLDLTELKIETRF